MATDTLVHTNMQLTILEEDAILALREWLVDHPVRNEDGQIMQWPDGTPVALTVLQIIRAILAIDKPIPAG